MFIKQFEKYPDSSRIWIYGFTKQLSERDEKIIRSSMDPFIENWKSHGRRVDGSYHLADHRFIIFAISESDTISGCSIDSSVRILERLRDSEGLDALNFNVLFIENAGEIQAVERRQFNAPESDDTTCVYDLSLQTLGELRHGNFLKPFKKSWAATAFSTVD